LGRGPRRHVVFARRADRRLPQPRFGATCQSDAAHGAVHQPAAGRGPEEHHHARPDVQPLSFDPEQRSEWSLRWRELSRMIDQSPDISAFAERGGKLLLAHGLQDVLVSTRATEDYYERLVQTMGSDRVSSFVRFYEVPGFGHAVSSQFNATWDSLTALE